MKKYEILYDKMIALTQTLTKSEEVEAFVGTVSTAELKDTFISTIEILRELGIAMQQAKTRRIYYALSTSDIESVDSLLKHFERYQYENIFQIKIIMIFYNKFRDLNLDEIDEDDIDDDKFTLKFLGDKIDIKFYSSENYGDIINSVLTFSTKKLEALSEQLDKSSINVILLYFLLIEICRLSRIEIGQYILLKNISNQYSIDNAECFLYLNLAMDGIPTHKNEAYVPKPSVIDRFSLLPENSYQQFDESIHVLSEYNNATDLLQKYLLLYHVIENFMYRCRIADLQRSRSGKMFSLRDFHILFREIDLCEREALKSFLGRALSETAKGKKLKDYIIDDLKKVPSDVFDRVMKKCEVKESLSHDKLLKAASFQHHLTILVYQFRNMIVHNKETEIHLTHANVDADTVRILKDFFIPALEKLVFSLLCTKNELIWYSNPELALFKK